MLKTSAILLLLALCACAQTVTPGKPVLDDLAQSEPVMLSR